MTERKFKKGQIVRYSDGPTALCRLLQEHAGTKDGWHAEQYFGGVFFVQDRKLQAASREEVQQFVEEQRKRKASHG